MLGRSDPARVADAGGGGGPVAVLVLPAHHHRLHAPLPRHPPLLAPRQVLLSPAHR